MAFNDLMQGFGVVTVMNATIYKLKDGKRYVGKGACHCHGEGVGAALTPDDFYCTGLYLDTLKIANFTQEGPTKTVTGGQYANPLIKYGKTMTCEMQDALGRAATMVEFFGCDYDDVTGRLSVTDRFPGAFAIEGDTFFIDQKTGKKENVYIFIPQFTPDAILTLTQDAEGDATVFDLNGTVSVTTIQDRGDSKSRDIFYEVRQTRFFAGVNSIDRAGEDNYHPEDSQTGYHTVKAIELGTNVVIGQYAIKDGDKIALPEGYDWYLPTASGLSTDEVVGGTEITPTEDTIYYGIKATT